MGIPTLVVDLDEAHAAFGEAAGQQAVVGKGGLGVTRLCPVEFQGFLLFFFEVHQLRSPGLHAVGHLVGVDAGGDLGVADGLEATPVEVAYEVEGIALRLGVDPVGVVDVQDGLAIAAEGNPAAGLELYDLDAEIGETTNVAAKNPDVVRELQTLAKAYDADLKKNSRPLWRAGKKKN